MKFLTIDASDTLITGVSESESGTVRTVSVQESADGRHHVEFLAPMVRAVLEESEISAPDALIVGTGPAAFTGLRAALVTAQTLAYAWEVPIYGVSSLEALALAGADQGANIVEAVIDARRKEVFALRARAMGADNIAVLTPARVLRPAQLADELKSDPAIVVSADPALYAQIFTERISAKCTPEILTRLYLAGQRRKEAGEEISFDPKPQYLRRPDVQGGYAQAKAEGNPYVQGAE